MKEIRIHGRGGQGSLVLAQFMAIAALEDGKYGQAFPFLRPPSWYRQNITDNNMRIDIIRAFFNLRDMFF